VPEANVIVAHGQMKSDILEEQIRKFYMKEANVLVCTTIIENGIDIPDANTLIVCNADTLGLSQLYQLRGRVGRSNKLAYAYFTVNPNKVLTDSALKRLNAIMDYTELGSGFKIAMRDLEIRGAGNILGKEQHGHIEKVGYDMYCKLLQESIDEIKGIKHSNVTCQMDVLINSYLDKNYVEDENSRLKVLRDILDIYTKQDVENLLKRLKESFGDVPIALENLINVGFAKNLAQELEIEHVLINNAVCELTFANMEFLKNDKLMEAITNNSDKLTLVNDAKAKVRFSFTKMSNADKLRALIEFLLEASA
jgi:transcription-repair coupling factor (superfamily II helicase)